MRAKDFLKQLPKLNKMIENKIAEKEQWKSVALCSTSFNTSERVQTTPNPQKMSDAIVRCLDIEKEIDQCIDALVDTKKDVISVIEQLEATEYDVLHKVYVQNITLDIVADKYDNSYSWATTIHGKALKNVQKILDEREKEEEDQKNE